MTNEMVFLPPITELAVGLLALCAAGAIIVWAARHAARVRQSDVDWLAGGLASDLTKPIYTAYLRRHWRMRTLGCLAGLAVAVVSGLCWPGDTVVTVGIGAGRMGSDLLVGALAGITFGTLGAESYRLRVGRGPRRQARLEARPARPQPRLIMTARALAIVAIGLAALGTVLWSKSGMIGGALLAIVLAGLAEVTQAAITDRRRFASDYVDAVDQRLRAFAGRSVAWLELSGAILGLGWCLSALEPANDLVGAAMTVAILACLVLAFVALQRSSGRAPRGWQPAVVT
ncbi:MAG: hypothetical protein FWD29_03055 [Micrococcales bacterium]|nr:hypothetical protein [Micrococcales bacterium]